MSERLNFVQHYIESKNQDAARAMEELPADIVGSLLEELPEAAAITALTSMLPYHASICLQTLESAVAIKYLTQLTPGSAASILRCFNRAQRSDLLRQLPRRQSLFISLTMNYSQQLVGAWMDPDIQSLPLNATVADARKRISAQNQNYNVAFTVSTDNTIHGSVSVVSLLQHPDEKTKIATLAQTDTNAIFASTRLKRAVNDENWARSDVLPVVDRQRKLIGALRFLDLLHAVNSQEQTTKPAVGDNNFLGFTEFCYVGLADLVSMSLAENSSSDKDSI